MAIKKDKIKSITKIDGIWHDNLTFDSKRYWNIE